MSQANNEKFVQQQSESELAGLKNQVEDNLDNGNKKTDEAAAEGIAQNLEQAKSQ